MNKKTILIICGFILTIILTAILTIVIIKPKEEDKLNNTTNVIENESKIEKADENKVETPTEKDDVSTEINENKSEEIIVNKETSNNSEITSDDTITPDSNNTNSEADVINYVQDISLSGAGDKLKSGFVTIIDFLFYDGEIYGKTFSELSSSAKIKVISLALKIDAKVEEYFPGYKETISNTTNKVYTNIKSKLVSLYLDTTVKICSNNQKLCIEAKRGLNELKQNFNVTWEFVKDISGVSITKIKDWYEVWKEK